ncbi:MAG: MBL fold metallo-hydrolase [Deltaproteobacteria bacterium]|nr:MBL fold metallo-hydrolase [Deltaproteobacteria bacterium]
MIELRKFEEITQIRMKPERAGHPPYWISSYLVDGLLIDTGCKNTEEEFIAALDGRTVLVAVNTHHHEDHVGANKAVKEKFGIEIFAHREAVPIIAQVPDMPSYRLHYWGRREPCEVLPLGDRIETPHHLFEVIETPGHCGGHVALVERARGWCFSGDLYISKKPNVAGPEFNVAHMIRSMKRILSLDMDRIIVMTSALAIEKNGQQAFQECVSYLEELCETVKDLYGMGMTPAEMVTRIFGRESPLKSLTDGQYSTERLVLLALEAGMQECGP